MVILTKLEAEYLLDYIREVEALVQADDGTLFPLTFVNMHEAMMEIFLGDEYDEDVISRHRDDSD